MVERHRPLLYLETSVFGFYFDEEPRNALRREAVAALLGQVRMGVLGAVTSPVTFAEMNRAPEPVRSRLLALLEDVTEITADRQEVERLAQAYVREGIIPEENLDDARHVAYATAGKADVLVSLNLKHIANERAERRIGAVNLREGYGVLRIKTPEEVLAYED
jgi:predicted nucleic acid-binding protein